MSAYCRAGRFLRSTIAAPTTTAPFTTTALRARSGFGFVRASSGLLTASASYTTLTRTTTAAVKKKAPLPTLYTHSFTTTTSTKMTTPLTAWNRLIRYVSAKDGSIRYGEPIVSEDKPDIDALALKGGLRVKVLEGENPIVAKPTGEEDEVKQGGLLGPLTSKDVPIVRCVGLNYRTHSK